MKKTQHVEKGSGCPGGVEAAGGAAGAPQCRGAVVVTVAAGPSRCCGIPGGLRTSGRARQHRAAAMETPWLGKPMATHTSTREPPHGSWQRCRRCHRVHRGGWGGTPRCVGPRRVLPWGGKTHPEHHDVHPRAVTAPSPGAWGHWRQPAHGWILPSTAGPRWGQPGDTGAFAPRRTRVAPSSAGGLGHEVTVVSPNSHAPPSLPRCASSTFLLQSKRGNWREAPHAGVGGGRGGRGGCGGRGGPAGRTSPALPALVNI